MLVFALVALALGYFFNLPHSVGIAVISLFIAIFVKPLARWISHLWLAFGEIIGLVSNGLILSVVYFFILTPTAILYRLTHRNSHFFSYKKGHSSHFINRDHNYTENDLLRPW